MGLLNQAQIDYYGNEANSGSYQFTSLEDVINNFIISYVGEDKIISKIKRSDVQFHAMRSMQELSFDTFKSIKSQELIVPPSLKLMLPQDYVNYTNIAWVDSSGIHHTIHPTSKASNPKSKGNIVKNSNIEENATGYTLDSGFSFSETVFGGTGAIAASSASGGSKIKIPVNIENGKNYQLKINTTKLNATLAKSGHIKVTLYGKDGYAYVAPGGGVPFIDLSTAPDVINLSFNLNGAITGTQGFQLLADGNENLLVIESLDTLSVGQTVDNVAFDNFVLLETGGRNTESTSFNNFKSSNNSNNTDDDKNNVINNNLVRGQRYGLDPQYAQDNGTFFIDNNMLHFGSSLNGKTIVVKYISDGLAVDEDMIVHKLAEEAMYKCIAYAILSTRINTPEYVIQRFRKEKFAATRKAKLRLSNLKLEELTQILRGKSKHIKH